MSERAAPRPYGIGGLVVFFLFNLVGWLVVFVMLVDAINYDRGTGGSVSMAQAAYITSLWTKVIAYGVGLLSFDVVIIGLALCSRITALHEAVIWAGTPRT